MSLLDDATLQSYVAETANKFNIPGLGIALVDLAKGVVSSKGFCFPASEHITGDTVFQIFSNTKLFTTVAYGILVEEGKCRWDSKLCDLLPALKLQNGHAQRTLTVEDLLSHQSGLSGHIVVEASTTELISDVVESIGGLRFSKPARAAYQYCNVTFTLVGHIVSVLSGLPFADFVETRILAPLGMSNTTWTVPKDGTSAVQGYLTTWGDSRHRQKIPLPCIGLPRDSVLAAAGSILSTAADMAKWLAFLLRLAKNQANSDDLKVLKAETMREILRSRVIANQQIGALPVKAGTSLWEEMAVPTYALGQLRGSYRGVDIASHNGTGLGGGIILLWTPGGDFGICVLTNTVGSVYHAGISIALTALDMYLGRPTLNWNARLCAQPWAESNKLPRVPEASETLAPWPTSELCGQYTAASYGSWEVIDLLAATNQTHPNEVTSKFIEGYLSSKPFGKTLDRKPTMLAVCLNMVYDAYELHHIREGRYFGVPIRLVKDTEGGGTVLNAPVWTNFGAAFCARFEFGKDTAHHENFYMEYFTIWSDDSHQSGLGKGTATFAKIRQA